MLGARSIVGYPAQLGTASMVRQPRHDQHATGAQITLKNKLLVSTAAPTSGALIPLYSPRNPSRRRDCLKQSNGPVYCSGKWSGCDWRRTFTVSKGSTLR